MIGAMIGRERERAEVRERLAERRLVTVTGPAGIGKTTLAMTVAQELASRYELGAHVVDLTRIDSAEAVAATLAGQLGFPSFDALLNATTDQSALVVVDNCEHVTAAAADAIAAFLATCHAPTVLATSRSPLDLPEESLVVLGPLGVPAPGEIDAGYAAVRLFLERARDGGAVLRDGQLAAVVELCRRLDGLPLAIELAAARARTMHPAEILARLESGVEVLSRPRFRGVERHRSLAATIEWSYRLLPPDAAAMLDRLSLSSGPFTGELAEAVGADLGLRAASADDVLHLLVDSSLLVAEPAADRTRYRLLETVRSFAVSRLAGQGLLDEARASFADHVVHQALELLSAGGQRWDIAALARLHALYDNIVAALRNCLAHDDDGGRGLVLSAVLWGLVHQGGTEEIGDVSEQALARWPDLTAPFATDAAATAATARCLLGDPAGAITLAERALAEGHVSPTAAVTLRRAMGYSYRALGDRTSALATFEAEISKARDSGLLALALEAEATVAQLLGDDGQTDVAIERAQRTRAEAAAAGSVINEVWARTVAAHLRLRDDPAGGLAEVQEVLAEARRIEYPAAISVNQRSVAWALRDLGDYVGAARCLQELLDGMATRSSVADLRGALFTVADMLHAIGDDAWAPILATARALPLVGPVGTSIDERVKAPAVDVEPLTRREAAALARARIRAFLGRAETSAPDGPVDLEPRAANAGADGATAGPARAGDASLVDHGEFWAITYAGRTVHAKTSKGLVDLTRLLCEPGRELHCLDLMGAGVEDAALGELIDGTARREYEQRIRDLQDDVEAAERDNDYVRAERAQAELDTLVDHLSASLGLGGRARRPGGSTERARSAVTQRIRAAVRRLGQDHPELGRHLEVSIVTGTYCAYRPELPVDWRRDLSCS